MHRRIDPRAGPWLLATLGLFVTIWSLRPDVRAAVPNAGCERVAVVGHALLCNPALQVTDACGTRHRLRSGDAFDPTHCDAPGRMTPEDLAVLEVPIDPNLDGPADLQSLPGIGPVLAARIVEGRPYADAESLLAVRGIGPVTLRKIRPRLTFSDPRP